MVIILDRIIAQKKQELSNFRESIQELQPADSKKRSFIERLEQAEEVSIIAEFKRASPSKGIINDGIEPVVQAKLYENYGASAISVLTDQTFFKGSFSD